MVFATNVNVLVSGGSVGTAQYNPGDFVGIDFDYYDGVPPTDWKTQDIRIDFVVENNTKDAVIEGGYVYQCGDLDPDSCVDSISPEAFSGRFEETYNWIDIMGVGDSDISNFVVFARVVKSGKAFWTGFHYQIKKSGFNVFYGVSDDVSGIEIHARDYSSVNSILNFMQSSFMIPLNPAWVERVIFHGVNDIFEMKSDTPPSFETETKSTNVVSSLSYDYDFVFSATSSDIYNAVVLNFNPSYTCGSEGCETDLGENSNNCCLDCGCITGYYCDAVSGCRNENTITLSLSGTQDLHMSNCYQQHQAEIYVKVNNAPSDMIISSSSYSLAGSSQNMVCSPFTGDVYSCPITIQPVPGCSGETQTLGPNSITFDITYSDGVMQESKTLSTSFPDITIGSFSCGDGFCQEDLGEDSSNCCYDCGCGFGYCDIENLQDKEDGLCRSELSDSNLQISLDRDDFSYHVGSESVGFNLTLNNAPSSLELSGEVCSLNCERSDGYSCSASCSLSCSLGSSENDVYQKRCSMVFGVSGYDNNAEYILTPVINASASYYDGPDYTGRALSKTANSIRIGANWCGDRICIGGSIENSGNCCFDCACPGELYCDSDVNAAPEEDSCESLGGIGLNIFNSGPYSFSDSAVQSTIEMSVEITNKPSGMTVIPSCQIGDGDISCNIECVTTASYYPDVHNMLCSLTIPPVNYKNPDVSDIYDSVNHKLSISDNQVSFALSFNDGHRPAEKVFEEDLQDIVLDVIWHCGDGLGVCETDLGESSENCCVDCGCSENEFCHTANNLRGECTDRSEIQSDLVTIVPDPMECTIELRNREMCIFMNPSADAVISIDNLPVGTEIVASSYAIRGLECRSNTTECPMTCIQSENMTGLGCRFLFPNIPLDTEDSESGFFYSNEGEGSFPVDLYITIEHPVNSSSNAVFTEDFAIIGGVTVSKKFSTELKTCNEMREDMEDKEDSNDKIQTILIVLLAVFTVITIVMLVLCECTKCNCQTCCEIWPYGMMVTLCMAAAVLPLLGSMKDQIVEMESQYAEMCATDDLAGLQDASENMGSIWYNLGGAIAGIGCMMSIGGNFGSGGGENSGEGGGFFSGLFSGGGPKSSGDAPVGEIGTDSGGNAIYGI
jgi:hypothetical protein